MVKIIFTIEFFLESSSLRLWCKNCFVSFITTPVGMYFELCAIAVGRVHPRVVCLEERFPSVGRY